MIWETQPDVRGPVGTYPDFLDWRAQAQSFQGMAAFSNKRYGKAEVTGYSETIAEHGMSGSQDLFHIGRGIIPVLLGLALVLAGAFALSRLLSRLTAGLLFGYLV